MPAEGHDPFTPRGADSVRAMLLVTLGEFAFPREEPVWNATLVGALSLLGFEAPAIGQAVRRAAANGLLAPQRSGRRVAWQLTPEGRELLRAGGERVFSFGATADDWDGTWLTIAVSVPERDKHLRHQLRRRLQWLGFGSPSPGLWVSPHAGRAEDARRVLAELGLERRAMSGVGPFGPIGDEQAMVDAAWDLAGLAAEYRAFVAGHDALRPRGAQDAFRAHVRMTQAWRRFPYLDPGLPPRFLPARWPGARAARLVARNRERWGPRSRAVWDDLARDARDRRVVS